MEASTQIVIWSTDCRNKLAHVLVYDNDENSKSVNIPIGCELTVFDVCDIVGLPESFNEGFIRVPRAYLGKGAIGWSFVSSPKFNGAAQTLLGLEGSF